MTIKEINKELSELISQDEKIVDIDHFTQDGSEFVSVVSISINHVVWKRSFYIENNELHFLSAECL